MDSTKTDERSLVTRHSIKLMRRMLMGFKGMLDDELRPDGVTMAMVRFLFEVQKRPGASGAQLARACFVTPQSAQTTMAQAVKQGWVVRGKDAENGRLVTARLTPAGDALLTHVDKTLARLEAEVWAGMSLAELGAMNELLERGLRNLKETEHLEGQ